MNELWNIHIDKYAMQKLSIRTQQFLENYNLRQNIVDKFTKISKLGFSMECLAADFLHSYGTAL